MAFYLDPVRQDTGCLRGILGSQYVGDKLSDSVSYSVPGSRDLRYKKLWGNRSF